MTKPHLVLLGEIVGAFGVRGEVRVRPYTEAPEGVVAYGPLTDADGKVILTPKKWRSLKLGIAITAPEVKTREEAEALKRVQLFVPRDRLPAPDEDEFYHVDLIGCRAENEAGEALGEVIAVHDFGAREILEIARPGAAPLQLPFTRDVVPAVDLSARRVVVRPLPEEPD
ncbi:MAG: 16S rRNA processing protein RimM [Hyphomonadaceae bacterium]|nr:16S rRNA processing protein RimM [Hyphomonadaceae bacterium]